MSLAPAHQRERSEDRATRLKADGLWDAYQSRIKEYREAGHSQAEAVALASSDFLHAKPADRQPDSGNEPFADTSACRLPLPDIAWCYQHLGIDDAKAPSPGAAWLLDQFRANPDLIAPLIKDAVKPRESSVNEDDIACVDLCRRVLQAGKPDGID